jgi:hypothetical protein
MAWELLRSSSPSMRYLTLLALVVVASASSNVEARVDLRDYAIEGAIVPGNHQRLDTPHGIVHVWAPEGYRAETASLIVYVHGYFVNVDDAWWAHGLPEQFGSSSINALFVAVEAPSKASESVQWCSITELVDTIRGAVSEGMPKGKVIAIGHSGAYRTLDQWLADPLLDTVVMLDAGYGSRDPFLAWVRRSDKHRLITVSSDTTWWCHELHKQLPGTRTIAGFPERPESMQHERIVHIRTTLDHWQVVTTALPATLAMLRVPRLAAPTLAVAP